ncbi:MAG TPA: L-threonylcarbamoyladenylate synthase [Acidimicrobiia bacterium]|nr:L-threonylcarbamoyladenylate synthase [Acidimicrobiia bacterium]
MIDAAVRAVANGEVVGLPTDTVYGVGVDPFNVDAVARLFELKGRPEFKPIGVLAATTSQAREIGFISDEVAVLADRHWPGALTLVVAARVVMAEWVGDVQTRTIGVRVPDHPSTLELLKVTGPLAVTSANVSGGAETMNDDEARAVFGDKVAVYLEGSAPGGQASTVVDATGAHLVVLRQGPVEI